MIENCEIVDYTEKSCAVIGETKDHKENLKKLGCKFNNNLNINGEKVPGWIFSKKNKEDISSFIQTGKVSEQLQEKYSNRETNVYISKYEFDKLVARVAKLEKQLA